MVYVKPLPDFGPRPQATQTATVSVTSENSWGKKVRTMKTKKTGLRRLAAGAGALALGLTSALVLSATASADVGPDQPNAPTSGTLTINKYSGSPTSTPDPANALSGVEFTVTQVGRETAGSCTAIDLTDAADWAGLDGLFNSAPAAPADPFCLLTALSPQETVNGTTTFDLPVGVYFVQETDPGQNSIVSSVPNFYVSIPTSDSTQAGGWDYSVVADPKNQLMEEPTKTITARPEALVVGSVVTWELSIPVPTLNNDETFNEAVITDTLDSRLTYKANSSTVTIGATTLQDGTDYNVTGNAIWTLTPSGRAILNQNQGGDLTITFQTTVDSVGNGTIPNDDYKSTFNGTTVPGEVVPYTYWGQLSILKTDDSQNVLKGAEFQVFEKAADAACPADAPAADSVATGTSDANGVVQWGAVTPTSPLGLWVANSDTPLTNPSKDYCVYETVVPAGHTAVAIDNPVTISASATAFDLTVVNTKKEGPDLPLTGGQGTLAMTTGGLLLIGLGAAAVIATRRRNQVA